MQIEEIKQSLNELADPEVACHSQRFFKTGPGEYGEGDVFLGIRVPQLRSLAKHCQLLPLEDIYQLLTSAYHEERLLAVIILVNQYKKANAAQKLQIYRMYLTNKQYINNWDLVDTSADPIVGAQLLYKDRRPLYRLVKSKSLWDRRIAIMATFHFIKQHDFNETLGLAELLLCDKEDLLHKAVGWMLREIGKRDIAEEERFLQKYYQLMPRTMLRYAIEKFPKDRQQQYLKGYI